MVVHGGLFHTEDTLLSELNAIDRVGFSLKVRPIYEPFPNPYEDTLLSELNAIDRVGFSLQVRLT